MKHTRLLVILTALAVAASPFAWGRSSGFSSSRSSSSSSSFSSSPSRSSYSSSSSSSSRSSYSSNTGSSTASTGSRNTSSYSAPVAPAPVAPVAPARSSGFSTSSRVATAAAAAATTGLGATLYAAHASKSAADTYVANKAAATNLATSSNAATAISVPSTANVAADPSRNASVSPPQAAVQHYRAAESSNGSGAHTNGLLTGLVAGYAMGRSGDRDDSTRSPAAIPPGLAPSQSGPSQDEAPTQDVAELAASSSTAAQDAIPAVLNVPTTQYEPPAPRSDWSVVPFAVLVGVLGLVTFAVMRLLRAWRGRKSRYSATNNYKL